MTFGFLFAIIAYAFAVGGHLLFAGELGEALNSVNFVFKGRDGGGNKGRNSKWHLHA